MLIYRAPCVIFIDEIDSVGSKRTSSVLHPYANQTINQVHWHAILIEQMWTMNSFIGFKFWILKKNS